MKKVVFGLVGLFIASQFMVSCSSESEILSQFSKRKYLKKYKAKEVKYEDKVGGVDNDLAFEQTKPATVETVLASNTGSVAIPKEGPTQNIEEFVLTEKQELEISKITNTPKDYSAWNNYNRNFIAYNKEFNHLKVTKKSANSSDTNAIILIILCLLVLTAPLAVYLFEGSITNNFWLDLVLLLTLFGAAIYGLLVCFANVSIA